MESFIETSTPVGISIEGYLESFSMTGEKATKTLTLKLKYYDDKPVIDSLKRISYFIMIIIILVLSKACTS
jgi:ribosomal protein S8